MIVCLLGFMFRKFALEAEFSDRDPPILRVAPQPSEPFASLSPCDSRPPLESVRFPDQSTYRHLLLVRVQPERFGGATPIPPSQREAKETRLLLANEKTPSMLKRSYLPQ